MPGTDSVGSAEAGIDVATGLPTGASPARACGRGRPLVTNWVGPVSLPADDRGQLLSLHGSDDGAANFTGASPNRFTPTRCAYRLAAYL